MSEFVCIFVWGHLCLWKDVNPLCILKDGAINGGQDTSNKRKDLSKFLGLDDSDSEEIVFIQNTKPPPQAAQMASSYSRFVTLWIVLLSVHGNQQFKNIFSFESCLMSPANMNPIYATTSQDDSVSNLEESILGSEQHYHPPVRKSISRYDH